MSRDYADNRVREALKKCGGNAYKARQQLMAWVYEDTKLLHALTKPHLSGIVAYNIERILNKESGGAGRSTAVGSTPAKPKTTSSPAKGKAAPGRAESFGLEILKAAAGAGATFGFEDTGGPRRKGASKAHVDALHKIAKRPPKAPSKR